MTKKLSFPHSIDSSEHLSESHQKLIQMIEDPEFACIGAKAALKLNTYQFKAYGDMLSIDVAKQLCFDLYQYIKDFDLTNIGDQNKAQFISFVAHFSQPQFSTELHAAECLDILLKNIHEEDKKHYHWCAEVSSDPDELEFAFSVGGEAFFIPLFHPHASSKARVSNEIYIAFNSHSMFEHLRALGKYEALKAKIRARQQEVHLHLANFGEGGGEYIQYALVSPDLLESAKEKRVEILGKCPFSDGFKK